MKKLILLKVNQVAVTQEFSIGCDFCGEEDKEVFTSAYDSHIDQSRNESQICYDCVKQLYKKLPTQKQHKPQ